MPTSDSPVLLAAALRAVVVLGTAAVAGSALLRPVTGPPRPVAHRVVLGAAVVAAGGTLLSIPVHHAQAAPSALQAALVVGTALLLDRVWPAVAAGAVLAGVLSYETASGPVPVVGAVHTAAAAVWLGTAVAVVLAERGTRSRVLRRLAPWALGAGVVVVGTGLVAGWLDGLRPDATSAESAFGRVLFAKTLLVLVAVAAGVTVWRRRVTRGASRAGLAALGAAVVAGSALAALPLPPAPPVTGVPLLRTIALGDQTVPVAVVPQRPGVNLVHVGEVHVGVHGTHTLSVGTDPAALVPVSARPGSRGGWAAITLPAGRSRLWIAQHDSRAQLRVDTGGTPSPVAAALAGPDGAECASAALGALVAGATSGVTSCPADRLDGADAATLRELVGFLSTRRVSSLGVVADSSPRSRAAAAVVRTAAAAHHLAVTAEGAPSGVLVIVAGWGRADATVRRVLTTATPVGGLYLAPWLAAGGLLEYSSGAVVALRFDPYSWPAQQYAAALAAALPGEAPSPAGYTAWRVARHERADGPTLLYAAAQVSYLPAELGHEHGGGGWVVGGRLTAVTPPLAGEVG